MADARRQRSYPSRPFAQNAKRTGQPATLVKQQVLRFAQDDKVVENVDNVLPGATTTQLSIPPFRREPEKDGAPGDALGNEKIVRTRVDVRQKQVLRLRSCFAVRNNCFAQDDKSYREGRDSVG